MSHEPAVMPIDNDVTRMIALIEDLIAVIRAENAELTRGVPATLSTSAGLKANLASELENWVGRIKAAEIVLDWATPSLRETLNARAKVLDTLIQENLGRLQAGIDATRFRVDAIMRAIREQAGGESGYDDQGRQKGGKSRAQMGMLA